MIAKKKSKKCVYVCERNVCTRGKSSEQKVSLIKISSLEFSTSSNAKKQIQNNHTADAACKWRKRGLQPVIITIISGSPEFVTPWTTLLKTNEC